MTELTKDEITELALFEYLERDLVDIEFGWDNRKRRLGGARYIQKHEKGIKTITPKGIYLSSFFFDAMEDKFDMVDTLYHEMAHILAFYDGDYGHGEIWKAYCILLGADPTRCSENKVIDQRAFKYTAYCPNEDCDNEFGFSRLGKRWRSNLVGRITGYWCSDCDLLLKVDKNY